MEKQYLTIHQMDLKQYNSMHIESLAEIVYIPLTGLGVFQLLKEERLTDCIIIGQGSNTIFSKHICDKPVVITSLMNSIQYEKDLIVLDAGVSLSKMSWFALEHSVAGYEFLEDIPGSVGGALYMNAGTYEDTISDRIISVKVYSYSDRQVKELSSEQLKPWWGKRTSYFQSHPCFIIQATFNAGNTGKYEEILDRMLEIKRKRYLKQPRNYPSAGSVFKRPYVNGEPKYIWQLFDEAGLRGYRIGDAQVSEKHPGFIVNVGNATGKDVVDLVDKCKKVIWDKYGIKIEEEWRIV